MKSIVIAAAVLAACAPAFANSLMGCETVDIGGYSNKADPSCIYTVDATADHGDPQGNN